MTTPHSTPFSATTPHAIILVLFVIISNSGDEITTLPVRSAPPSPDRTPALYSYPLDFGDDSSDEDLKIPSSSSSSPPSLLPSLSSPPPSLLPSSSHKRSKSPSPSVLPSPLPSPPPVHIEDLIESREAYKFEMAELRSQAQDIEASFLDLESHLGP
nr:hypothetical protein [Tanacetum cinerariifolium]